MWCACMQQFTPHHMADVFAQADEYPFSSLHFSHESRSQLKAIIAIHSTDSGPALGGTRLIHYPDTHTALQDALRLARGMTYKSAINHLAYGGGKAVILMPDTPFDRRQLLEDYGRFVESLGGQYITAVDSGTSPADMDIVAQTTRHVVCTTNQIDGSGDPSPYTARGVLRGIQAALFYQTGTDDLNGRHIAIQGVGHVGFVLARLVHELGATLTIADHNPAAVSQCVQQFSCQVVEADEILSIDCDVVSPCALGQVITADKVHKIRAGIIAGSANNQLADVSLADIVRNRGILYAPDYVINSGGMLQIAYMQEPHKINQCIDDLYQILLAIFKQSESKSISTQAVADQMAEEWLMQQRIESESSIRVVNK